MEGNHRQLNEWLRKSEIDVLLGYMPIDVMGAEVNDAFARAPVSGLSKAIEGSPFFETGIAQMREHKRQELDMRVFQKQPFILLKKETVSGQCWILIWQNGFFARGHVGNREY